MCAHTQTHRETHRQTHGHRDTLKYTQIHRRNTDTLTDIHRCTHTDRHRDTHRHTHTETHTDIYTHTHKLACAEAKDGDSCICQEPCIPTELWILKD